MFVSNKGQLWIKQFFRQNLTRLRSFSFEDCCRNADKSQSKVTRFVRRIGHQNSLDWTKVVSRRDIEERLIGRGMGGDDRVQGIYQRAPFAGQQTSQPLWVVMRHPSPMQWVTTGKLPVPARARASCPSFVSAQAATSDVAAAPVL